MTDRTPEPGRPLPDIAHPPASARWSTFVILAARLLLAAVFVAAGVPKLMDAAGFATAIDNYHVLPPLLTRWAALALPVIELCIAIALLVPRLWRGAATLSMALLLLFAGAMLQAMARDINLDCGCFGSSTEVGVDWTSVARNVALASLAAWSLWTSRMPQPKPTGMLGSP